jgi:hypothetical protein
VFDCGRCALPSFADAMTAMGQILRFERMALVGVRVGSRQCSE